MVGYAADVSELLRFDSVSMTYPNDVRVLSEVDLSVSAGEFVSIVGPSGCGKSTLLKLASGLTVGHSGTITLADIARDNLGYVFQEPTLLPWRNVYDNVKLISELKSGRPAASTPASADSSPADNPAASTSDSVFGDAIEQVGLTGWQNNYPHELSGGMKMRVSLARALTQNPRLFLFDEPFGALDELTRYKLNDLLAALFTEKRFGALFITHSIPEAVYLSTKVLVMSTQPGAVVGSFDIDFGYPRASEDRYSAKFNRYCADISAALAQGGLRV